MQGQILVDVILDRLPNTSISFALVNQGGSMSKIKYYVN